MYSKTYKVIELYICCKIVYAFVYHRLWSKLPHPLDLNISFKRLLRSINYFAHIKPIHKEHLRGLKRKSV